MQKWSDLSDIWKCIFMGFRVKIVSISESAEFVVYGHATMIEMHHDTVENKQCGNSGDHIKRGHGNCATTLHSGESI